MAHSRWCTCRRCLLPSETTPLRRPCAAAASRRRTALRRRTSRRGGGGGVRTARRYAFAIARRLWFQGRLQETEDLLRWAVDGLRAELGEQKIDTIFGKVELAKFLASVNRTEEAADFLRQAVSAGAKSLGVHNLVMLEWQEKLAALLSEQGEYTEAAGLLRQLIRGSRRWREEARLQAAAERLSEVLNLNGTAVCSTSQLIQEAVATLPDALDSLARQRLVKANEKSSKLSAEGNLNQAEHVLKRALAKATLALPVADPDLLVTRLNLGALRQRSGKADQALLDLEEVFQAQVTTLGPDHVDTKATVQAIGGLGENLHARYQGALSKLSSATHRSFVERTKETRGKQEKTVQRFEHTIRRFERKLGSTSHGVLKAKFHLAQALAAQDRSSEAFPLWRGVLQDQLRSLGPFHQSSLTTQREMLHWIYQA
ncbi:unnamed protein product [Effrenium voratum]|nr:unnamed protein product [Effrenium voratum]